MSDEPSKRRVPSTAWKPGQSGNPHGRPRRGDALAEVIRSRVPPEALVARALELMKSADERVALGALVWLRDSAYIKPAERHEHAVVVADTRQLEAQRVIGQLSTEALWELLRLAEGQQQHEPKILVGDHQPADGESSE